MSHTHSIVHSTHTYERSFQSHSIDIKVIFVCNKSLNTATLKYTVQKPESGNQRKQDRQIRKNYTAQIFPIKIKKPKYMKGPQFKLGLKHDLPPVKICATVISSEGYGYENLD